MADRTHDVEEELTGGTDQARPDDTSAATNGDEGGAGDSRRNRDQFISSEVSDRTSPPMRNPKTRS